MTPKQALKEFGWNTDSMVCRKIGNSWRLTLSDKNTLGDYTKNYLISELEKLGYRVTYSKIYPLPTHSIYAVELWDKDRSRLVLHIEELS